MSKSLHQLNVYQDEYVKVEVDEAARFIYVEWLLHPDSHNFRRIFQKLADITLQTRSAYWLSDARAIRYIEFADQNWLLSDIVPRLKESQLVKFARLSTPESLALLDVVRIYDMVVKLVGIDLKDKMEVFTDKEAALHWLFADA